MAEVPFDKWGLDMKLEAMVPSIIDVLHGASKPGLSRGDFGTIGTITRRTSDLSRGDFGSSIPIVRTNVTAHIGTVVNVDLSNYK